MSRRGKSNCGRRGREGLRATGRPPPGAAEPEGEGAGDQPDPAVQALIDMGLSPEQASPRRPRLRKKSRALRFYAVQFVGTTWQQEPLHAAK